MKQTITIAKLLQSTAEIEALAGTGLGLLFANKIRQFYTDNGIIASKATLKTREIQKKYLVFDGDMPKMSTPLIGSEKKVILLPGKKKEDYMAEYEKYFKEEVTIII